MFMGKYDFWQFTLVDQEAMQSDEKPTLSWIRFMAQTWHEGTLTK